MIRYKLTKLLNMQQNVKPDWLKVKAPTSPAYNNTLSLIKNNKLNTVCEAAACPNIGECWAKKHVTIMILGNVCTRACKFCNIATGRPNILDSKEPERVADTLAGLGMEHIVITSVDRDDLPDGGAKHFAKTIKAIRKTSPNSTIEILTPDFQNKKGAIDIIIEAQPDVFNHNLETVPRLYPSVRPGAKYFHSLKLLATIKENAPHIFTKSGLMAGLGEDKTEIYQVMDDMRMADIDFITIGQYLQPTVKHHPVMKYVNLDEFEKYATRAKGKGFLMVSSSPLTRSSYLAGEDFKKLKAARIKQTQNAQII